MSTYQRTLLSHVHVLLLLSELLNIKVLLSVGKELGVKVCDVGHKWCFHLLQLIPLNTLKERVLLHSGCPSFRTQTLLHLVTH